MTIATPEAVDDAVISIFEKICGPYPWTFTEVVKHHGIPAEEVCSLLWRGLDTIFPGVRRILLIHNNSSRVAGDIA